MTRIIRIRHTVTLRLYLSPSILISCFSPPPLSPPSQCRALPCEAIWNAKFWRKKEILTTPVHIEQINDPFLCTYLVFVGETQLMCVCINRINNGIIARKSNPKINTWPFSGPRYLVKLLSLNNGAEGFICL